MTDESDVEEWRTVVGHPDYEVSNIGRLRCAVRRRYLRPGDLISIFSLPSGYRMCSLDGGGRLVHRIVCAAFNGPPPSEDHEVAHNNGARWDNRFDNLRWSTHVDNCADVKKHGTSNPPRGEKQGRSKLKTEEVMKIRELRASGSKQKDIADMFNVCRSTINAITNNYNWKHL